MTATRSLFAAMILAVPAAACAADVVTPPNVVVIFIDDLGYADIGPFGATKQRTPHLDRMAAEGMKLTSFYAAPVCSVSRAQLMTGCYGARVSVPGVFFPGGKNGLHPKETTIAEHLKARGYVTQMVGKWHLGDQAEFLPMKQGFDHYLGVPYSNDMIKPAKDSGHRVVPLVRDDKVEALLTEEEQTTLVDRYTQEATGFLRANKDRPFFLYLAHNAVHTPIHPGKAFQGKSANGRFGDWVEETDWSVGQVLDTLRELKLDRKTLVLFTSDNGPWLIRKADGGSAGPLRGGKGSTWEGGVRVPTVAWWPGRIAAKASVDTVASTIDVLPTCVALAGGTVPAAPVIDGRDFSPVLFGKSTDAPREAHYYFSGYSLQAVRQGPWKLALATQPEPHLGANAGQDAKVNPRLYNLDADLGETTNLAAKHPEIVAKLQKLADAMAAEIAGEAPKARRPAGTVEKPVTLYPTREEPKPVGLGTLKVGDTIKGTAAPMIAGKAFTIACTVDTELRDTIILAHGGATHGYALHVKDGKVVFSVRTAADTVTDVASVPIRGAVKIEATLAADGSMTLKVGDQAPATGKAPGPIARQPAEDFCLGHDNGRPVATYTDGKPFTGSITGLAVTPAK
jgi:arylsulfatase A-like enzyme